MSDNTVEIAVKLALNQFRAAVDQLEQSFGGAMSRVEAEAAVTGGALDEAFRTLGTKSVRSVEQEVQKLQVALAVVRNLPGVLPADAERATQAFNARIAELRGELNGVPPAAKNTAAAVNDTAAALGNAAHKALAWGAAIAGVNGIGDLAKKVIDTGSAFEQLEGRLASLLGSQEAAADAFDRIKKLAATTPFEVNALTEAYAKLTAFGLEPSMDQMLAMADTAATLGGGTQMLERVTLALGQAWTKGKLQGGEIMQMAEAGVPVWDLLARATGKNVNELQKMSEAGQLGRDVIKALIDEMGRQNAGASAKLMDTYAGAVSNAKDATAEFFSMIAQSGVLDYLKAQIQAVLAEYERMKDTGELQAKAKAIADTFVAIADGAKTVFEAVQSMSGVIKIALEAFAVQKVLAFAGALREIALASTAAGVAAASMSSQVGAAGTAAATAAGSVGLLSRAVGILKGLTLVGLAEGVVSLGMEFFRAKRAAEEGEAAVRKMLEAKPAPVIDQVKDLTKNVSTASDKLINEFNSALTASEGKANAATIALDAMVKAADFATADGINALGSALKEVEARGLVAGQTIDKELRERIAKMSVDELRTFDVTLRAAMESGSEGAQRLGGLLNVVVDASLAKLGIAAETALGGMSRKFVEANEALQLVIGGIDQIAAAGMDAGATLEQALDVALKTASTKQDMDALAASVKALGDEGKLSKEKVADMLDAITKKSEDSTDAIDSVGEALRRLGVKSQAELQKVADSFKDAWKEVEYGNVTLREKQDAFRAYAEAAIAANQGVADSYIQTKAEALGLNVEIDNAGQATVRLKQTADRLKGSFKGAADEAGRMADNVTRGKQVGDKPDDKPKDKLNTESGIATAAFDIHGFAAQYGINDVNALNSAVAAAISNYNNDPANKEPFGGLTGSLAGWENFVRGQERVAREAAERVKREEDLARIEAQRAKNEGRPPPPQPATVINLTLPGAGPIPVYTDPAHANKLVDQLRSAGAVSYR